jgi:TolB-like protein/class 3 adenylate cyclase
MERRLAAVMIADVVGYGRLSQIDEEGTRARFQADLHEVFEPKIAGHRGRLVKTMGDGLLVEFPSVVDALRCAVEAQQAKAERNKDAPAEQRLVFRTGINLGDIIVEGDDIHGDGVNIADRIQAFAEPGGVAISGAAYDHVKTKLPVGFASLGEQRVKNIAEPVRVYRVVVDPSAAGKTVAAPTPTLSRSRRLAAVAAILAVALAAGAMWRWSRPPAIEAGQTQAAVAAQPDKPSLVVLPFDNLSDDREQGYLADGITEDLTTELARIPGLFVISRNAAFTYKGKAVPPAEIARELGVRYILEGSTRRAGDEMRLNAQLIDAETGGHVWADRFDGQWADVFALQDKVIANIAGALKLRLVSNSNSPDTAGGTSNPAAYDAYLRGLDHYLRDKPGDMVAAVSAYQEAISLDPNFGAAWAQLAYIYWDADDQRRKALGLSWDEVGAKMYDSLDVASKHPSPAYYQLRAQLLIRERKSGEAIAALQKGVALDPSHPWTLEELSKALTFNGQPKEGYAYVEAALRVDPGWGDYRRYLAGQALFGEGRFEDAAAILEEIDVRGSNPWPKFYGLQILLSVYGHLGRIDEIAETRKDLKAVLKERDEGDLTLLRTQWFFVYEHEADIERLLAGLRKAGVPEVPADLAARSQDRLTGSEIKFLVFGHELRGQRIAPETADYIDVISMDGTSDVTVGTWSSEGKVWVQADFICAAHPKEQGAACHAVFRNPSGTLEQMNEYLSVGQWSRYEFSVVK